MRWIVCVSAYRPHREPRVGSSHINGRGWHINFLISVLVGGLLGWVVSRSTGTSERQEIILNVVAGIIGVVLGRAILSALLAISTFGESEFNLPLLLVSLLGAMVPLIAVLLLGGSEGRQSRPQHDAA
jgi:uncharacterized membrane protein YeaQ/YmgE (transglycosylase-associated protein family)